MGPVGYIIDEKWVEISR